MESKKVIVARNIKKEYGQGLALSGLNLEVNSGQILGLIGPNGAGKSTFLQAVLGLVDVEGELEVLGLSPKKQRHELLKRVCSITDVAVMPKWMTVRQVLNYVSGVHPKFDLAKAIRFCKSMERFNIDYIEQPIASDNLEDLSELRFHTEIKIAVDESLTNLDSAYKLIENQSADIFVIKPMTIGQYLEVNEIIKIAKQDNIECVITNMLDSSVNRMACIHIALSNNINRECGISGDNLFDSDIGITPKIINGKLSLPNCSGLGIVIND